MRLPTLTLCLLIAAAGGAPPGDAHAHPRGDHPVTPAPADTGVPQAAVHLHHVYRLTPNILSGSSPEGEAAFAELAALGVRTLVSVDGARPDVAAARKHGLRYVHLPIGYDGISSNRVAELAKAARSLEGPLYVHCHHGLHRGPAAAAVLCQASAGWSPEQAVGWLRKAGTSPEYRGLYHAVEAFRPPAPAELARLGDLPEVSQPSSLVDAMVALDLELERLKEAKKHAWAGIPNQPDISPAHTATLIWELLRELERTGDTAGRPEAYRRDLAASTEAAGRLRNLLREGNGDAPARDIAFTALQQTCVRCHKGFRN